jgi:filamentous hemagglutinin family protein
VAAGSAVMSQAGAVTTIRTGSRNTIINYQRLDVLPGATLRFAQPTADSRVLNRIQSTVPSKIDGAITSNGTVYLVNPAGVMFGKGAVINAGQFFAAASHITDANFLKGVNQFTDSQGRVVNQGLIRGQQVHLLGAQVENAGKIVTDGSAGIVTLTAGKDILIGEVDRPGDMPRITVRISGAASNDGGAAVTNSGTVNVGRGQVRLGAGDVYGMAINNSASGLLKGKEITLEGGRGVVLAAGTIDASNEGGAGGVVKVLGQKVAVTGGTIDASGTTGGGKILIGGDFHGAGSTPTAERTAVSSKATISADATDSGNGGKVVVWSDQITGFYGKISARGGPNGGDGGRVEVSGKQLLDFTGAVDTTAARGQVGSLLLDPDIINLDSTGTDDTTLTGDVDKIINAADGGAVTFSFKAATLQGLLATSDVALNAVTAINVSQGVNVTSGGKNLTLAAPTINFSGTTGLTLNGGTLTLTGNVVLGNGANVTLSTLGGGATGGGVSISGSISGTSGGASESLAIHGGSGGVSINAVTGNGASGLTSLTITGDTLGLAGNITVAGTVSLTSSSAASSFNVTSQITANSIDISTKNTFVLGGAGTLDTSATGGDVTIRAANISIGAGSTTAGTGSVNLFNIDPTQAISLGTGSGFVVDVSSLGGIDSAGKIVIGESGVQSGVLTARQLGATGVTIPIELNSNSGAGGVVLDDGGAGTALHVGGDLIIRAGTGGITAATATNNFAEIQAAGTVSLVSAGDIGSALNRIQFVAGQSGITVNATDDAFIGGLGSIGFVDVTAGGDVDIVTNAGSSGDIDATGVMSGATIKLNADGAIGALGAVQMASGQQGITLTSGGDIDIDGVGNLTFLSVTAGGDATVTTHSGGNIEVSGTVTGGNIVLDADGGIGTNGTVTIDPSGTVTLRTHGAGALGNIDVSTGSNPFSAAITINTAQTVTLAGGAVTLGETTLTGADLVITGTTLTVTGGAIVAADDMCAELTAGVSVQGTVNLTGNYTSTGTTFTLGAAGAINVGAGKSINVLHTGAVALTGDLNATGTGTVRLAGSTVTENAGAAISAGSLAVHATGGGTAIDLGETNTITSFGATTSTAGAAIVLDAATGIGLNAVSGLAASGGFPAFAAVNGASANNGDVTLTTATGNITGGGTVSGAAVTLTATAGGMGCGATAVSVTPGTLALTTGGANAAGDIFVTTGGAALNTSDLAVTTAGGSTQTISLASGAFTVDASLNLTGDNVQLGVTSFLLGTSQSFNAEAFKLVSSGAVTLAGDLIVVSDARIAGTTVIQSNGGITTSGLAVIATSKNGSNEAIKLTAGTNTVTTFAADSGAAGGTVTLTTGGAGLTVGSFGFSGNSGGVGDFAALNGITTNGGAAVVTTTGGAALTVSQNINLGAGDLGLSGGVVSQTGGTITARNLGVRSTLGVDIGNSGTLNLDSSSGLLAASATTGNISIKNATNLTAGTVGPLINFASLSGVTATAGNVDLSAASGAMNGGPVNGAAVTLTAPDGIGTTGALTVNATGTATFNTSSASPLGNIHITTTNAAFSTLVFNTDLGTVQVINIEIAGALLLNNNVNTSGDTLIVHAGTSGAGDLSFGAITITSPNITLQAGKGDGVASTAKVDLSTVPAVSTTTTLTIRQDASIADAAIDASVLTGAKNYTLQSDGGDVTVVTGGSVLGTTLTLNAPSGDVLVNGAMAPNSLVANVGASGLIHLGANVTTTAGQTYNGNVQLDQNVALSAANFSFNGTIDSAAGLGRTLSLTSVGPLTLSHGVGMAVSGELGTLTVNGAPTLQIGAGISLSIETLNGQTYNTDILMGADATLNNFTSGDITFNGTINGSQLLEVSSIGNEVFNGKVGGTTALNSLRTDASGPVTSGGFAVFNYVSTGPTDFSVRTSGAQTYNDHVQLNADTVLSSTAAGTITLGGAVDGAVNLTVNSAGDEVFGGKIGAVTPLTTLTTDDPSSLLSGVPGGTVHFNYDSSDLAVTSTDISVTTTGGQVYNDNAILGGDTVLKSTGNGNITFVGTLDATTMGGEGITVITAGDTTFNGMVGDTKNLKSITTDAAGNTIFNNAPATTTVVQDFFDNVILNTDTVLTSAPGGSIHFWAGVNSADPQNPRTLTIHSDFDTIFDGPVGDAAPLLSLTVTDAHDFPGGAIKITGVAGGGTITTIGGQTYGYGVELSVNTVMTSTGGGTIEFVPANASYPSTINGAFSLTVNTAGDKIFSGQIGNVTPLAQLITNDPGAGISGGMTILQFNASGANHSVVTTGLQTYNTPVRLDHDTILTSTGSGAITFEGAVDSVDGMESTLAVNTAGTTWFKGDVGAALGGTLGAITTDLGGGGSELTKFGNGGAFVAKTTGAQAFNDDAELDADGTFNASDITFGGTLNSASGPPPQGYAIVANAPGVTWFKGDIGQDAGGSLGSITTDASGGAGEMTKLGNSGTTLVTTTGFQLFGDSVLLTGNTTLTSTAAGDITFGKLLNGGFNLVVNTGGVTQFNGVVGGATALTSVTTDGAGSTQINTTAVSTTGLQLYGDDVTLGGNLVVASSGGGAITFDKTVNGAHTLQVNTAGVTRFNGIVGGTTALTSLTTDGPGGTTINTTSIRTSGSQLYGDDVVLLSDATPTSTGLGSITFNKTVNGGFDLVVSTGGNTRFNGVVGGSTALASVSTVAGGRTQINTTGINTTGLQLYGDAVDLLAGATLTSSGSGSITFNSTIDGNHALVVHTGGGTRFNGVVGGESALASLTTDAPGTTEINTSLVRTNGLQLYGDAVGVLANTTLTSNSAGSITFDSTVNGGHTLHVNTAGVTAFGAAVGGTTPLASLATNAGGTTKINGGAVTTSGAQIYSDAVVLGDATDLSGSTITLGASLNSVTSPRDLVVHNSGTVTFAGPTGTTLTLGELTVAGAAGTTFITGPMNVQGLTIAGQAKMSGSINSSGKISVAGSLQSNGTIKAGTNLEVTGTSQVTGTAQAVRGDMTLHGDAGLNGTIRAGGDIVLDGTARLAGEITAGGEFIAPRQVMLTGNTVVTSTGNGIRMGNITGANSSLRLVTDDTKSSTHKPLIQVGSIGTSAGRIGDLEFDSAYVVRLGGDIYARTAKFAGADRGARTTDSEIATVSYDGGDLTIDTDGEFTMEQGQKLSVFDKSPLAANANPTTGNLTITSNRHAIQIGDLSALGRITIDAGTATQSITIVARPASTYLKPDGTTARDRGVDIVSGYTGTQPFLMTGTLKLLVPTNVKATDLVQFAAKLGGNSLDPTLTFGVDDTNTLGLKILTQNQVSQIKQGDFQANDFVSSGAVLDLVATGVGNPVNSVGAAVQNDFHLLAPERNQAITGALKDALWELGIFARDLKTDELVEFLIGRSLYDDVPYKLNPTLEDNQIASNRLPFSPVIPVVDAYRALFLKTEVDKDGNPVLDEKGKPKTVSLYSTIQNTFGQAWMMYLKARKEGATPEGFRAFLEAGQGSDAKLSAALGYLDKLRDLLLQIKGLGLTEHEFDVSRKFLLARVRPQTVKFDDFSAAIMGPSTHATGKGTAQASR